MYFKNFPSLRYPISGQLEQIQDVLLRVGFSDKLIYFIKYPRGHDSGTSCPRGLWG